MDVEDFGVLAGFWGAVVFFVSSTWGLFGINFVLCFFIFVFVVVFKNLFV